VQSNLVQSKGPHGDGDHGNPAVMETHVAAPVGWKKCRGTPAGMERNCAGFMRECSSI